MAWENGTLCIVLSTWLVGYVFISFFKILLNYRIFGPKNNDHVGKCRSFFNIYKKKSSSVSDYMKIIKKSAWVCLYEDRNEYFFSWIRQGIHNFFFYVDRINHLHRIPRRFNVDRGKILQKLFRIFKILYDLMGILVKFFFALYQCCKIFPKST
jgi:hypothetical protein